MDQKSNKNRSKVDLKSIKNPPREPWEASWGLLGRLGVSWGRLGASCGRPGGVLGRLGGVLARKRWPTWLQLGLPNRPKIDQKSMPKGVEKQTQS